MPTPDPWAETWRAYREALAPSSGADAFRALAGAGSALTALGLAAGAYQRFAQDFAALAALAGRGAEGTRPDSQAFVAELEAIAQRFFASAVPKGAAPPPGTRWAEAAAAYARVLAAIAHEAAQRFAARLSAPGAPATLRAAFDAWIDCAEAAFQQAAHGEAYADAQAKLLNEYLAARGEQLRLIERSAHLAGLPTRADLDALYASLRALRTEVEALRAAAPKPAAPARKAPTARKAPPERR